MAPRVYGLFLRLSRRLFVGDRTWRIPTARRIAEKLALTNFVGTGARETRYRSNLSASRQAGKASR